MPRSIPYIPGKLTYHTGPLARYLPPLPQGIASTWLANHLAAGSWVLDPFGSSPQLAIEAAQAGYRVLVAANNPIARALLEMTAHPPTQAELRAALADLAAAPKGDERIEPHIRSLYNTECEHCGRTVEAEYFLWERQASAPYARYYHCPTCGDNGERPATRSDVDHAARWASAGLHRARALERVSPLDDPDRPHAEEALAVYLPRAVYALFTLINRLDGPSISPARKRLLQILLLNACDQANTLWPHPTLRERPRQLTIPPRFRENNIWIALEQGIDLWASADRGVPLSLWPEVPPSSGGISLFEGRLKDLAGQTSEVDFAAVVCALPRPNQAFWTLSALWSGWLWGRETIGPFKSVLRRRRYDWAWHTAALSAAMENLAPLLAPGISVWGLIGEAEPGFVSAALLAAEEAGFELEGLALRSETCQMQISWKRGKAPANLHVSSSEARAASIRGAAGYLEERGQPSPFLALQSAAVATLAREHAFPLIYKADEKNPASDPTEPTPAQRFNQLQSMLKSVFTFKNGFLHYEGSEQTLDAGQWWLRERPEGMPLFDRIEIAAVRYLQKHPGCTLSDIDRSLCELFPGLLTPDLSLIQAILESYGEEDKPGSGRWSPRPQDSPAVRRSDLDTMRDLMRELGEKLGFSVILPPEQPNGLGSSPRSQVSQPYAWIDRFGEPRYLFYILASAAIGEIIFGETPLPQLAAVPTGEDRVHRIIVLPGSRANLAAYKLEADASLRLEVEKGWRFLKYRHLRRLIESPVLTHQTLEEQLDLDPLAYNTSQIRML